MDCRTGADAVDLFVVARNISADGTNRRGAALPMTGSETRSHASNAWTQLHWNSARLRPFDFAQGSLLRYSRGRWHYMTIRVQSVASHD